MDSLDFTKLKRNPEAINSKLIMREDRTIAKEVLSILIPKFYFNKNLGKKLSKGIELICVFPILDDKGNYGVIAESASQTINYGRLEEITVGDDVYESYTYLPGDIILETTKTVKSEEILFPLFDAYFMYGKFPKFLTYQDVSTLFEKADMYTGSRIGNFPVIMDILVSALSRSADDPTVTYKDILNTEKDMSKPIHYVGLSDLDFAITNTGSRIIGGYFDKNMNIMSITKETKHVKDIDILRK